MRKPRVFYSVLIGVALLIGQAAAQVPQPNQGVAPLDCRVEPGQKQDERNTTDGDRELSETLEKCRSVLEPPDAGDGTIVMPPPEAGKTPVIPPAAMPEQQPAQPK